VRWLPRAEIEDEVDVVGEDAGSGGKRDISAAGAEGGLPSIRMI